MKAQSTFKVKCLIRPTFLSVNGVNKLVDSNYVTFNTNYPAFDSFAINDMMWSIKPKVLADFKPDSLYVITYGCCSEIEIFPARMLEVSNIDRNTDDEKADSIHKCISMGQNQFIIEMKGAHKSDSIYAWNNSAVCTPMVKLLDEKPWYMGKTEYCLYSSSIRSFQFFKIKNTDSNQLVSDISGNILEMFHQHMIEELGRLTFRFFDRDKYRIVFDYRDRTIKIFRED